MGRPGGIEQVKGGTLKLDMELVSEYSPTSQNCQIPENRFTVISKPRSLNCHNLQLPTKLVQDASSQCLAINVFSDDN
jgi:hypothetical protein